MLRKYDKRLKGRQQYDPWMHLKRTRIIVYHKLIELWNERQADETMQRKNLTESEWFVATRKILKYDRALFYECVLHLMKYGFVIDFISNGKVYYYPADRKQLTEDAKAMRIENQIGVPKKKYKKRKLNVVTVSNEIPNLAGEVPTEQKQETKNKDGEYHYDGINDIPDLR